MDSILTLVVALSTWLTPMRGHVHGWLIVYGGRQLIEANADYRGYDLTRYNDECAIASMSPSNLGGTVWLRPKPSAADPDPAWFGPCGIVDTAARIHFYHSVYEVNDIAEIPRWLALQWGTEYGLRGEAFYGDCPPPPDSIPSRYWPPLRLDPVRPVIAYSAWPYPAQQSVVQCNKRVEPMTKDVRAK